MAVKANSTPRAKGGRKPGPVSTMTAPQSAKPAEQPKPVEPAKVAAPAAKAPPVAAKPVAAAKPVETRPVQTPPVQTKVAEAKPAAPVEKPVIAAKPAAAKVEPVKAPEKAPEKPVAVAPTPAKAPEVLSVAAKPAPVKKPEAAPVAPAPAPATIKAEVPAPVAKPAPVSTPSAQPTPATSTAKPKEYAMTTLPTFDVPEAFKTAFADFQDKAKAAYEKSTASAADYSEFAKGNIEAMVEAGKIFAAGLQELSTALVADSREAFETMTNEVKTLAAAKTPTDFVQIQSDLLKKHFDKSVAFASKQSEAALKLASETVAPISGRVHLAVEKVKAAA